MKTSVVELTGVWIVLALVVALLYCGGCHSVQGVSRDVAIGSDALARAMEHYTQVDRRDGE